MYLGLRALRTYYVAAYPAFEIVWIITHRLGTLCVGYPRHPTIGDLVVVCGTLSDSYALGHGLLTAPRGRGCLLNRIERIS